MGQLQHQQRHPQRPLQRSLTSKRSLLSLSIEAHQIGKFPTSQMVTCFSAAALAVGFFLPQITVSNDGSFLVAVAFATSCITILTQVQESAARQIGKPRDLRACCLPSMSTCEWNERLCFFETLVRCDPAVPFHIQVMRGSITRQLPLVNIVVNSTLVVWACAELRRDLMSERTRWCFVIGTPLLSYYCLVGLWLARRAPQAGEALRPATNLVECRRDQQASALLVLAIEFVQFNSLPFNSELGAWHELEFSSLFRYSFLQCEEGCAAWAPPFDGQLRFYCSLGLAWVLFALITLFISHAHQRQLNPPKLAVQTKGSSERAKNPPARMESLSLRAIVRDTIDEGLASARGLGSFGASRAGAACAPRAGTAGSGPNGVSSATQEVFATYTMSSPLWEAVLVIVRSARTAWRIYVHLLGGARDRARRALWEVQHCRQGALVPVLLLLFFVSLLALVVIGSVFTVFLACAVLTWCMLGLLVCAAFGAVTLLHFGIVMNMLSVLLCTEAGSLPVGIVPEALRLADAQVMQRLPTQQCWAGMHWNMVAIALSTLIVLYPVMVFFERKRRAAAMVSYHVRFTSHFLFGKLALSAFSLAFVSWPPAYLFGCAAALFAFLHVNNEREQDNQPACCNVRTVRLLRSMVLCCALWSSGATLATYVLPLSQTSLIVALLVLWALTAAYFLLIIWLPHFEPRYHSEPPSISGRSANLHPGASASTNICGFSAPFGAHGAGSGDRGERGALLVPRAPRAPLVPADEIVAAKSHSLADGAVPDKNDMPSVHAQGADDCKHSSCAPFGVVACIRPECDNGMPLGASASLGQQARLLSRANDSREGIEMEPPRMLGLSAAAARSTIFLDDDGFERPPLSAAVAPPGISPILVSATLAQTQGAAGESSGGGLHAFERVLGVINGVDATVANTAALGPSRNCGFYQASDATELARQLEESRGPVTLLLQRPAVRLRASGCKHGASWEQLELMGTSQIVRNMSLYPQDARLQAECCTMLRLRLERLSAQTTTLAANGGRGACEHQRSVLMRELAVNGTLGVIVNALECHERFAAIQLEAAELLRRLAESGGTLRSRIVAAGALPVLIRALHRHAKLPEVVAAHCELAAEIAGARGAPACTRRDLCKVLAAIGALAAVLHALRRHPRDERIAGACCTLLLAFMEEFEARAQEAPPELYELFSVQALRSALAEARAHCAGSATIKLAATWFLAQRRGGGRSKGSDEHATSVFDSPEHVRSTARVAMTRFGSNAHDGDSDSSDDDAYHGPGSSGCSPVMDNPYDSDPFDTDPFSSSRFSQGDSDVILPVNGVEHCVAVQKQPPPHQLRLGPSLPAAMSSTALAMCTTHLPAVLISPLSAASSGPFSRSGSCDEGSSNHFRRDSDPFSPDSNAACSPSGGWGGEGWGTIAAQNGENEGTSNFNCQDGSRMRPTSTLVSPTALSDGRLSAPPPPISKRQSLTCLYSSQLSAGEDGMMRQASLSTMQI